METNERGNIITREFAPADRYIYDFKYCTREKGWQQYDTSQDAHYFGVWVNEEKRQIFTYCEGDTILVDCPTEESYHAELASMDKFYGPPPPAFTVIDFAPNTITEVYDTRPV